MSLLENGHLLAEARAVQSVSIAKRIAVDEGLMGGKPLTCQASGPGRAGTRQS